MNDRNRFFSNERFGCSGGADGLGEQVGHLRATMGRFGTSFVWVRFQIFMMLDRNPGRRLQLQVESCPRLDRTLLLSSIICLSDDDGSFG